MTELRNVAVVLAGGTGTRVGLSIPKQLIKIAGKTIIEHTIAAFEASPLIDEIVILMTPGHLDPVRGLHGTPMGRARPIDSHEPLELRFHRRLRRKRTRPTVARQPTRTRRISPEGMRSVA